MTQDLQPQPPSQANEPQTGRLPAGPAPFWRRQSFWRVVGSVLSLALFIYLIYKQGWNDFLEAFSRLPVQTFFIALGLMLLSRISVSLRWFALLRSAKVKLSLWQSLRLTFMGLFASNFLPTTVGGDLVRLAGAVYLHIDAGISAASLVVDRLVGMAGMASLAPFGMAIVLRPVGPAGQAAPVSPRWAAGLLAGLARLPGVGWAFQKVEKFARSLLRSAVYWLRHPASLAWALLCTYGHMLFTFLTIWLLLLEMHQPLSFWWIAALWSLNYFFTTLVPVSINGLGLQEVSITTLYSHFGGVSTEAGLALAVLMRLLPLLASLPGVLFLPDILRPMPEMQQEDINHENRNEQADDELVSQGWKPRAKETKPK